MNGVGGYPLISHKKKMTFQARNRNNAPLPPGIFNKTIYIYIYNFLYIEQMYIVDVMLHVKPRTKNEDPSPTPLEDEGSMEVIPMLLDNIYELSSIRIELPDDLTVKENKALVKETLKEVKALKV